MSCIFLIWHNSKLYITHVNSFCEIYNNIHSILALIWYTAQQSSIKHFFSFRSSWLNPPMQTHPYCPSLSPLYVAAQLPLKLTPTNFPSWRAQFNALLLGYDLTGYIQGSKPCHF